MGNKAEIGEDSASADLARDSDINAPQTVKATGTRREVHRKTPVNGSNFKVVEPHVSTENVGYAPSSNRLVQVQLGHAESSARVGSLKPNEVGQINMQSSPRVQISQITLKQHQDGNTVVTPERTLDYDRMDTGPVG